MAGLQYQFLPNGLVDWRRLINPNHLAPNDKHFPGVSREELAKKDVSTLPDDKLIIRLQGMRELAMVRGYRKVSHSVVAADRLFAAVKTTIFFIPNYETDMKEVEYEALADAHPDNTSEIGRNCLLAIAENRGFVRAVRGFLGIPILGADELGKKNGDLDESSGQAQNLGVNPVAILEALLSEKGYNFADLKKKLEKKPEKYPGAGNYAGVADIPRDKILGIIEVLKEIKVKN